MALTDQQKIDLLVREFENVMPGVEAYASSLTNEMAQSMWAISIKKAKDAIAATKN